MRQPITWTATRGRYVLVLARVQDRKPGQKPRRATILDADRGVVVWTLDGVHVGPMLSLLEARAQQLLDGETESAIQAELDHARQERLRCLRRFRAGVDDDLIPTMSSEQLASAVASNQERLGKLRSWFEQEPPTAKEQRELAATLRSATLLAEEHGRRQAAA